MRSLQWYKRGAAYIDTPQNREGCVMDKSHFEASVTHVISLEINILSAYFWKIVMGDRCFAKINTYAHAFPKNLLRSLLSASFSIR